MLIIIFITFFSCQIFAQSFPIDNLISLSGIDYIPEGSVKLLWSYPGPDILPEGSIYYIQYATFTEVSWSTSSAQVSISTGPVEPFSEQVVVLSGLDRFVLTNSLNRFTTFYFVVFVSSATEEISLSNIATGFMTLWQPYVEILESSCGIHEGEINLKFQGSDDYINNTMIGVLSGYFYIQYSDDENLVEWSTSMAQIKISTHSFPSYIWPAGFVLTGLSEGVTYYIRMWAEDELGNLSEISNKVSSLAQVDISPPRKITSIYVSGGFKHVKLSWVLPYEDSYEDGFIYNSGDYIGGYIIKYHNNNPILDETLWIQATQVFFLNDINITPNISTSVVLMDLKNGTSYYFSIKTKDERLNWSLVSSSSPLFFVFNSKPNCEFPNKHFTFDPLREINSTIISSTTVIFNWSEANWHAGFSLSDQSRDDEYGDFISSYTLKLSTYMVGNSIGEPIIVVENIVSQSQIIYGLVDDTTYFWTLTAYDSEGASSTTMVFKFTINSQNTPPKFPPNPIITPNNTVVHTKTGEIYFDFKDAYDVDILDYIVGYKIFISTSENFESFITIPENGFLTTSYFLMSKTSQPSSEDLLDYDNKQIYWYVVAYDSGSILGYPQLSTQTPVAIFWINQKDEPPANFEIFFPTGTPVIINNTTFYKILIDQTTYYPIMEKIINNTEKVFIVKSTPIVLSWQPTYDPDPEDGVYEYAVFISSWQEPKNEPNAWRYVSNPILNAPPFEYNDWFKKWDFFISTMITKSVEEGTQEGYELKLLENVTYFFRIRALDAPQNLYWIWSSTETFSPSLNEKPLSFCIDLIPEPPANYDIISPTGTINPSSLEGPIYFEWTKPKDPDPFDSVKHYFLNISTSIPKDPDECYIASCWKINVYLDNPEITSTYVMFTLPTLKPSVTYYWQVHCWGENEWSFAVNPSTSQPYLVKPYGMALTTGSFVVSNQKPHKFNLIAPGAPIDFPILGVKTYRPTFYWEQVYDPDNYDPIVSSYVVIISSYINFSYYYSFHISTTRFVLNMDLNPRTTYYWYVKAYDKFGNWQTPNTTFYFCTVNFEPNPFELVYPEDDEIVTTLQPRFGFKNRGDPDNDVLYYKLYISTSLDFTQYQMYTVATNIGKSLGETIEVEIPFNFEENKRYFWQVVADDNYGGVSSSTISSFWINSIEESPMSFDVEIISGVLKNRFVNFSWQATYDNDPKDFIDYYKIIFSSVESYEVGFSTYIIVYGSTTVSVDLSTLKENALYRWWVEAYDTKGNYTKSFSSYEFIVDLQEDPLDDFYIISPGSTYTFVRVSQPINFMWSKANKTEWWKQVKYKIYLEEEGQISYTPFIELTLGPYNNYKEPQIITYSTSSLKENTTYYWFVLAENLVGTKKTKINYFFVDSENDPPEPFEIYFPSSTIYTRKPTFSWQVAFDKDDEISYYELKLSTTQNFKVNFTTTVIIPSTMSAYLFDFKLLMDATYYWRVRAYDERGLFRDSNVNQFYVPYFKPQQVEILSPKGEVYSRRPVFEWISFQHPEPNSRVEKYKIKIYSIYDLQKSIIDIETTTTTYQPHINLVQNTTYYYKIYAIDDDGIESDFKQESFFVRIVDIPSKVEKITYEQQQYKFILYWQKVQTYTDGSYADDIVGYNIYRAQDYSVLLTTNVVYKFVSSSITLFTDYIYFNTYYYLIRAVTEGNVEGPASDIITSLNSGGRIVFFSDALACVPKDVDEEIKNSGYKLNITTISIEDKEVERLNLIAKYKLELVKNDKVINYKFSQPITLEVILKEDKILETIKLSFNNNDHFKPAVFFNNGFEYIFVQNIYENNKIKFLAKNTGEYVIRKVIFNDKEPSIVNIYPKKIFTPASTQDNKIHFIIYNPTIFTPEGEIYDLNLRYVSKLKLENTELTWDGRYDDGRIVPRGVYIYKIKIGEKIFTGTVIIAK